MEEHFFLEGDGTQAIKHISNAFRNSPFCSLFNMLTFFYMQSGTGEWDKSEQNLFCNHLACYKQAVEH
jgi:hypothetical protein